MNHLPTIIQILILLPLVGAAICGACKSGEGVRKFAMLWSLLPLVLLAILGGKLSVAWSLPWMPDAGMDLRFVVDGLSFVFLLLVAVLVPFVQGMKTRDGSGERGYHALILLLQAGLFGVFTARHFVAFFMCWEAALIPAFLLIRMWGREGKAARAAMRFFMVTLAGGVLMLVGFLLLQLSVGTMDFDVLATMASRGELLPKINEWMPTMNAVQILTGIAVLVLIGIAVKIPIVPLHAWLPDAYAEAPTPVTILLTGLLSKMGVYALLRVFLPIFPEVHAVLAPWVLGFAVATVLLGVLAALAQKDVKRMLAYSSVNHLGYCALAAAAVMAGKREVAAMDAALAGVVVQAISHGIIAAGMFYGVSILESRSGGKRMLGDFGGLRANMPVLCGLMGLCVFASLGLPGLAGFVGEFLIFDGAFHLVPWAAAVSALGLLLTAVFLLRAMRLIFNGPLAAEHAGWQDLSTTERLRYAPIVALVLLLGLVPSLLLNWINPTLHELITLLK